MSDAETDNYQLVRRLPSSLPFLRYEARHLRKPGRFAVEVLNGLRSDDEAFLDYQRKIAALALLRHPHLLQVTEFAEMPDGTPIVVSELPEGGTLRGWLDGSDHTSASAHGESAIAIISALANALATLHERGIAHGSVGPENVLLVQGASGAAGLPKLQGTGLAALAARSTAAPVSGESHGPRNASQDIAALARLAEALLVPAGFGDTQTERDFILGASVASTLARATAVGPDHRAIERFDSVLAFATTLESALRAEGGRFPFPKGADEGAIGARRRPSLFAARPAWSLVWALAGAAGIAAVGVSFPDSPREARTFAARVIHRARALATPLPLDSQEPSVPAVEPVSPLPVEVVPPTPEPAIEVVPSTEMALASVSVRKQQNSHLQPLKPRPTRRRDWMPRPSDQLPEQLSESESTVSVESGGHVPDVLPPPPVAEVVGEPSPAEVLP